MSTGLKQDQDRQVVWVQIDCKGYEQMTKVAASKERLNKISWAE